MTGKVTYAEYKNIFDNFTYESVRYCHPSIKIIELSPPCISAPFYFEGVDYGAGKGTFDCSMMYCLPSPDII